MNRKDVEKFIKESLREDIGDGDHTSKATINTKVNKEAILIAKDTGMIAGVELAHWIFEEVDKSLYFKSFFSDGDNIKKQDIIFKISGNPLSILKAERLVLNCMQNMSAIATKTAYYKKLIKETKAKILDTRKTVPLNRSIQKWAVQIGGGLNHRIGLYDMIMIKDNHIDFAGGIPNAITLTKKYLKENNKDLDIIIETRNLNEIREVISIGGIKRILLDNFNYKQTKQAVDLINGEFQIESSGQINESNIRNYALCGVDYISVGGLTHSIKNFDLSLKAN
ncbi:MAG: carboxylating nicotinate-nucleotide diphosphorylase [Bacteroidota bacterium]|nr:carboxylating nicotinate-nucleotide diphosphorylase [Bacteroidota bacterium]